MKTNNSNLLSFVTKTVVALSIAIFAFGISASTTEAANGCREGQVNSYSRTTGELCPIVAISAQAQAAQNLAQCAPGDSYSEVTGEKCGATIPGQVLGASTSADCKAGDLFSAATGARCTAQVSAQVSVSVDPTQLHMTLKQGSNNGEVKVLQSKLIALGYLSGSADGRFGPMTHDAVVKFQSANNLQADGVVGGQTRRALNQ